MALNTIKEAVFTSWYSEEPVVWVWAGGTEETASRVGWGDQTWSWSSSNAAKVYVGEWPRPFSLRDESVSALHSRDADTSWANHNYTFASNVIPPFQNYFYNSITLRVFPVVYWSLAGSATKRLSSVRREIPAGSIEVKRTHFKCFYRTLSTYYHGYVCFFYSALAGNCTLCSTTFLNNSKSSCHRDIFTVTEQKN